MTRVMGLEKEELEEEGLEREREIRDRGCEGPFLSLT
jgi:hypothetical protein